MRTLYDKLWDSHLVREEAGGFTEWFRGASALLDEAMHAFATHGHVVHAPLRPWLRDALQARGALLYDWTQSGLDADDLDASDAGTPRRQTVRDALDAHAALGIDLAPLLPEPVLAWHRGLRG